MTLAVRVLYVCVILQGANKELVATLQYRVSGEQVWVDQ